MWRRAVSTAIDRWLGIRTQSATAPDVLTDEQPQPQRVRVGGDAHWYVPLAYGQARKILRSLQFAEDDVVYDVGCGLGRVVCLAARRPVRQVIGVECDAALAARAVSNIARLRGQRAVAQVIVADAAMVDYLAATVLILFNPFGAATTRAMLERLRWSLQDEPTRGVRIVYVNPSAEDELERCTWLEQTARERSARYRHTVSYWVTVDPEVGQPNACPGVRE